MSKTELIALTLKQICTKTQLITITCYFFITVNNSTVNKYNLTDRFNNNYLYAQDRRVHIKNNIDEIWCILSERCKVTVLISWQRLP